MPAKCQTGIVGRSTALFWTAYLDMANPEHLEILSRGVTAWNEWREKGPDTRPDLSSTRLSREDLRGANLRGALYIADDASIRRMPPESPYHGGRHWRAQLLGRRRRRNQRTARFIGDGFRQYRQPLHGGVVEQRCSSASGSVKTRLKRRSWRRPLILLCWGLPAAWHSAAASHPPLQLGRCLRRKPSGSDWGPVPACGRNSPRSPKQCDGGNICACARSRRSCGWRS